MEERKKRSRKKAEKIITDEKSNIVKNIESERVEIEKIDNINKIIDFDKENIIEKPVEIEKANIDYINNKNIIGSKEIEINKKIIRDNDKIKDEEKHIRETKSTDYISYIKTENITNEKAIKEPKEIGIIKKSVDSEVKRVTEQTIRSDKINKDIIEEINDDKDLEEIQNKQIKMAVFFMVAIILILALVFFIKGNFIDKFNYKGLVFQKTQLGNIIFYSTKFPVVEVTGQVIGDYAVNLRNDPRKLAYIPINTTNKKIEFAITKDRYDPVYISLNPFMKRCEDTGIALLELSGFLKDSGLDVRSAVTDKAYAEANSLTQKWCYNSAFDTIIIITDGNLTTINEIAPSCYEIVFNNCEVLQASERFISVILEDYASRFTKT